MKTSFNEESLQLFLTKDEVVSKIIQCFSTLDGTLDLVLARYFVSGERESLFIDTVVNRLSFRNKLDIMRKLKYSRRYKQLEVLQSLERLSMLRNVVAHCDYYMHGDQGIKCLLKRKDILAILEDFPHSLKKEAGLAFTPLVILSRTKDFIGGRKPTEQVRFGRLE